MRTAWCVHIAETIPGTGDLDHRYRAASAPRRSGPDMYAVIEHLPVSQIGLAKRNLTVRAAALGLDVH